MRAFSFLFAGLLSCSALATARADESRRFFDFTPISADNPVVATIDGTLAIPLSELRAYRHGERLQAKTDTLAQKRALLDDLVNEYLYVDEAYRAGVVTSPRFAKQMETTRTLILTDFMSTRALQEKNKTSPTPNDAAAALANRLFDTATIDISNEAYGVIKRAAKTIDVTSAASKRGPIVDPPEAAAEKLYAIVNAAPEAVAVSYAGKTISIHELLSIYAGLPTPRPPVETQEGFVAMIKPLITPELMALEAIRRGIAEEPEFQNKVIQNRNALLRFHVHGAIETQANEVLRGPALEAQLAAWYRDHAAAFVTPAIDGGAGKIPPLSDVKDRALADFSVDLCDRLLAEKAHELRKLRPVAINEAALQSL